MAKSKTFRGYRIETERGIEKLSQILLLKLTEASEQGRDLIVYVSIKPVRKEARELDRVSDANRFGEHF